MTTRRMPREQRRAQLLAIAAEHFSEHGFQGTSMDDVARAAGATKPVVYQHFASKEALYLAVLEQRAAVVHAAIDALGAHTGPPLERVESGLRTFYRLTATGTPLRLFLGEELVSLACAERVGELLDAMALRLARLLMTYRELDDVEARVLGRSLISAAQNCARLIGQDATPEREDEVIAIVARLLTEGLSGFRAVPVP
ncbi:TetR/AcrR family transcriptional regulator [Brachybacterium hainanense]|uniref:TetR/AcrR family transcriptional regulator n=1 Tax=Brachybacterium hainanense TaxID=1541174 RepID=A0ABV6RFG4_9MICO